MIRIAEYLSDRYNGYRDQSTAYRKNTEEDNGDDSHDSSDKEEGGSRLQSIYNILARLYNQQRRDGMADVETRTPQHRNPPDTGMARLEQQWLQVYG